MQLNPIYSGMTETVFETMSGLARRHEAINLGQGFPDDQGPIALRQAAARALIEGLNQYPPMRGLPELRDACAAHYNRHQGLDLTPDEVLVTSGATEAIAAALLAVVSPGDEVVIFEPAYDAYRPLIERAGGVVRAVQLSAPDWRLHEDALEAAITPRTRAIVFNNPLNPAARGFTVEEIAILARVCVRHDLIAISDEVWEQVVFDGRPHLPLMAAPGMRDRTIKIGSAGKMFSVTGWKVGLVCASQPLIDVVARAHQFLTFTTAPNLQSAVAEGLGWDASWFEDQTARYQRSRDRLAKALSEAGYVVTPSEATYFLCVDLAASGIRMDDQSVCLRLVQDFGVAAIPVSAFYAERDTAHVIRLCFAKSDEVLDQAAQRLADALPVLRRG